MTDPRAVRAITEFGAQQKVVELSDLLAFLEPLRTRTVLEIGSWTGGTMWLWSQIAGYVVSVDLEARGPALGELPAPVHRIFGDSHLEETRQQLPPMSFDVLFIDGDHSYAGVKKDFEMYGPMVAPDGVIVIHDIVWHPPISGIYVEQFWLELKQDHKTVEFVDPHPCPLSGQVIDDAGIGVLLP